MLHLSSWMTTLPIMVIGMVGIILVIGVHGPGGDAAEPADGPEIRPGPEKTEKAMQSYKNCIAFFACDKITGP